MNMKGDVMKVKISMNGYIGVIMLVFVWIYTFILPIVALKMYPPSFYNIYLLVIIMIMFPILLYHSVIALKKIFKNKITAYPDYFVANYYVDRIRRQSRKSKKLKKNMNIKIFYNDIMEYGYMEDIEGAPRGAVYDDIVFTLNNGKKYFIPTRSYSWSDLRKFIKLIEEKTGISATGLLVKSIDEKSNNKKDDIMRVKVPKSSNVAEIVWNLFFVIFMIILPIMVLIIPPVSFDDLALFIIALISFPIFNISNTVQVFKTEITAYSDYFVANYYIDRLRSRSSEKRTLKENSNMRIKVFYADIIEYGYMEDIKRYPNGVVYGDIVFVLNNGKKYFIPTSDYMWPDLCKFIKLIEEKTGIPARGSLLKHVNEKIDSMEKA